MNQTNILLVPILLTLIVGCASRKETAVDAVASEPTKIDQFSDLDRGKILTNERIEESQVAAESYDLAVAPVAALAPVAQLNHVREKSKKREAKRIAHFAQPAGVMNSIAPPESPSYGYYDDGRENYASVAQSNIKQVTENPVSTFSIDVDTGSYTNIRRMLRQGAMPPVDSVRVEEMINYFDYSYETPNSKQAPIGFHTELAASPWSANHVLLKVGLKGYEPPVEQRPASNLVFLLDVSGSMNSPDKLPLLKRSLILLSNQLDDEDTVSIVVYAGASGLVLEPTNGNQTAQIEEALNNLAAGGSTNGKAGIELAYQLAKRNFDPEGINRVILATDGDFNVGTTGVDSLKKLIEQKREEGISLTTLGFGTGNYNDELMEQLADVGNGNYAYIDGLNEARKVLVEELSSTLMTIAKDVKIQLEFNPNIVKEYRLLGYENRVLAREDFNNDKVDAGEIGAGHTVTALYELVLHGSDSHRVDPLRYQNEPSVQTMPKDQLSKELAFIKFRYKALNSTKSQLITRPIIMPKQIIGFENASEDFRFSATVAEFGEVLRHSKYISGVDYEAMIQHALNARGSDYFGYRSEFIQLLRLASNL